MADDVETPKKSRQFNGFTASVLSGIVSAIIVGLIGHYAYNTLANSIDNVVDDLELKVAKVSGEFDAINQNISRIRDEIIQVRDDGRRQIAQVRDEVVTEINARASEIEERFAERNDILNRLDEFVDSLSSFSTAVYSLEQGVGCISNTINACPYLNSTEKHSATLLSDSVYTLAQKTDRGKITINYQVGWSTDREGDVAVIVREELLSLGYNVTSLEEEDVEESDTRYFHSDDRPLAIEISEIIERITNSHGLVVDVKVKDLTSYHDPNPPAVLDLYLRLNP